MKNNDAWVYVQLARLVSWLLVILLAVGHLMGALQVPPWLFIVMVLVVGGSTFVVDPKLRD